MTKTVTGTDPEGNEVTVEISDEPLAPRVYTIVHRQTNNNVAMFSSYEELYDHVRAHTHVYFHEHLLIYRIPQPHANGIKIGKDAERELIGHAVDLTPDEPV